MWKLLYYTTVQVAAAKQVKFTTGCYPLWQNEFSTFTNQLLILTMCCGLHRSATVFHSLATGFGGEYAKLDDHGWNFGSRHACGMQQAAERGHHRKYDITKGARPLRREPVERDLRDQLQKLGTGQEFPEEPEDKWTR